MAGRIDAVVAAARSRLRRLYPDDVPEALGRGAVLVDIRPAAQRAFEGPLPGALVIERNVLEWRCDPTGDARLPEAADDDVEWVIVCSQGYTSSLAAAALQDLGLHRATDVVGGYQALTAGGWVKLLARLTADSPGSPGRAGFLSSPESILAAAGPRPRR